MLKNELKNEIDGQYGIYDVINVIYAVKKSTKHME